MSDRSSSYWWLAAVVLALGIAQRIGFAFESFWIDEAWSFHVAASAQSAAEIFTIRHDNNHILNTLFLYLVADEVSAGGHWIWCRLWSLGAGIASIALLGRIARVWGRAEAVFAMLILACSYQMVAQSGQARGYAGAVFGALLAFHASRSLAESDTDGARIPWVLALWVGVAVGVLSHATFVYSYAAAGIASIVWLKHHRPWRGTLGRLLAWHGVPVLGIGVLYFLFHRDMVIGGGPERERLAVAQQALAATLGLTREHVVPALMLAGLGSAMVLRLAFLRDRSWVFFLGAILLVPAAVIVATNPRLIYTRYFLICFPWLYLLVALALGALWRTNRLGRGLAVALLAGILTPNVMRTVDVLREGRNDYRQTVAFMTEQTKGEAIDVGSDHDFRNTTLLNFYGRVLPPGRRLLYRPQSRWGPQPPRWFLRHSWMCGADPEDWYSPRPGTRYRRVMSYPHGSGPGFAWFLYELRR